VIILYGVDSATCNISDTTMITINVGDAEDPIASFEADPISTCNGYGAQFTNTSTATTTLIWDFGDGGSSGQPNPLHSYDAPGIYDVWLIITDDVCGGSDSVMFAVDIPPATIEYELSSPVYFCEGSTAILNAGQGYNTYAWSNGSNAQMISVDEPGEYSVTVSEGFCTGTSTIQVLLAPEMAKMDDAFGCPGIETILEVPFETSNITWSTGEDTTAIVVTRTGTYWYTAIDPYGCTAQDTVEVRVIPVEEARAIIPNVFSPNNDGHNDTFMVEGITLQDFHMEVFNRWGQMVFSSSNPANGWNGGLDNSPDRTPEGTYFYVISFKDVCSNEPRTTHQGHVTLLR
jgi:gliding motility-associated-like protein